MSASSGGLLRAARLAVSLSAALLLALPGRGAAAVATAIASGSGHTCAVDGSGGLECWGHNGSGELGDGTDDDSAVPVPVSGLGSGVASVSAGAGFTCAVTALGGAKCWGSNTAGKLGSGLGASSATPVDVAGLTSGVAAVAAGSQHACALTAGGGVKCWGWNAYGQLGNGTIGGNSGTPVDVTGLASGVVAVAAGAVHTCALTSGGGVKCWGYNVSGQLGDGTTTNQGEPVDVVGLASGVAAIDAGGHDEVVVSTYSAGTCALTAAGGVKCWGSGFGPTAADVSGLTSDVVAVSLGGEGGGIALVAGGAVLRFAQSVADPNVVDVNGLRDGIVGVTQGVRHQCALTDVGEVKCWGNDASGQLGRGTGGFATIDGGVPGCVLGFGDDDADRICESADPCAAGATFVDARRPRLTLTRVAADPTPGDDKLNLRARFALPPGVAFADLDPADEGARLTLVDPGGVLIDRVFAAGAYLGPGTAGWLRNGPGTSWRFVDATTRPVAARVTIADRSKGAPGGEVDLTIARVAETIPIVTSDLPVQAIVVLGGAPAGDAGRCAQSDFRLFNGVPANADCTFDKRETALTCRVRR
jgi:alpha-tubulin suppressor-like RCC1 family protein